MRVISGTARGRKLAVPPVAATRPFLEMARGALFNILGVRVRGATVLDLYAGSGALGIEALSRGAKRAVFVERDASAIAVLQENLARCGFADRAEVRAESVREALPILPGGAEILFLDPPYALAGRPGAWDDREEIERATPRLVAETGTLVLRLEHALEAPVAWGGLPLVDDRAYGRSRLCFYSSARQNAGNGN